MTVTVIDVENNNHAGLTEVNPVVTRNSPLITHIMYVCTNINNIHNWEEAKTLLNVKLRRRRNAMRIVTQFNVRFVLLM